MPFIQAAGIRTQYQVLGKGPLLVLLHGWANTAEAWAPLAADLQKTHTLIIPDLPSFGGTATPSDQGWDTTDFSVWLQDFLDGALEKMKDGQDFALIGHSFGGKIAAMFTAKHQQPAPKKLILIAPSGIPQILSAQQRLARGATMLVPRALKNAVPTKLHQLFYKKVVGETDYVYASTFQKEVLRNILTENLYPILSSIKVPTLIIGGAHDTSILPDKIRLFGSAIRESTVVMCESSGHFPHHDETPKVSKTIKEFLHAKS